MTSAQPRRPAPKRARVPGSGTVCSENVVVPVPWVVRLKEALVSEKPLSDTIPPPLIDKLPSEFTVNVSDVTMNVTVFELFVEV